MSDFKLTAESFTHPIFANVAYRGKSVCEAGEAAREKIAEKYNTCEMFPLLLQYYEATKPKPEPEPEPERTYISVPLMRWGKYKGTPIPEIPEDYMEWIYKGDNKLYDSTKKFLLDVYYKHNTDKKDMRLE